MSPKTVLAVPSPVPAEHALWHVTQIVDVVDGDTIKVMRQSEHILSDWLVSVVKDRRPVTIRLARLDTPEMHGKTATERAQALQAKAHLSAWIVDHLQHGFTLTVLGDGGFSRILGDLCANTDPPTSASDYMRSLGWPDYVRGA